MAVLFTAVLVDMMGFGIVIPVLPFYALELGASPLQVTLLIASFSATQMAATPIWGRVSDRRGRRPLLIAGLFASAVSYLIFGLATSLWLLLLSRMAAGTFPDMARQAPRWRSLISGAWRNCRPTGKARP